ncbi:MAG: hypothetical protein MHM6MM_002822 [Cercozoa sp. M6MM]
MMDEIQHVLQVDQVLTVTATEDVFLCGDANGNVSVWCQSTFERLQLWPIFKQGGIHRLIVLSDEAARHVPSLLPGHVCVCALSFEKRIAFFAFDESLIEVEIAPISLLSFELPGHPLSACIVRNFLCVGLRDAHVAVLDLTGKQETQIMRHHYASVTAVVPVKEKRFISAARDGRLTEWELRADDGGLVRAEVIADLRGMSAHMNGTVHACAVVEHGENYIITARADGSVVVTQHGRVVRHVDLGDNPATPSMLSAWDFAVLGDRSGEIHTFFALQDRLHSFRLSSSAFAVDAAKSKRLFAVALSDSTVIVLPIPTFDKQSIDRAMVQVPKQDGDRAFILLKMLRKSVAVPSVSVIPYRDSTACFQCCKVLRNQLESLGAQTRISQMKRQKNPVLFAKFSTQPTRTDSKVTKVVFYGHYDVQPANEANWQSDPYELRCENGFLYGRGTSDNKGPVLAIAMAFAEAIEYFNAMEDTPDVQLVMVIEGEEENDSKNGGVREAVLSHSDWCTPDETSAVLVCNSYWLDDTRPAINCGMRGVLKLDLAVHGPSRDFHSGLHGGAYSEPTMDMAHLLSSLQHSHSGDVLVPHFYDDVLDEARLLPHLDMTCSRLTDVTFSPEEYLKSLGVSQLRGDGSARDTLSRRWCRPSLSLHALELSSASRSVISRSCTATVSVRLVPNQTAAKVAESIETHLRSKFAEMTATGGSGNTLDIDVVCTGDWWQHEHADQSRVFACAREAVKAVWKIEPDVIREGGSLPCAYFLQETLRAPVAHIPLGQASDRAHLDNERIRLRNLLKGVRVVSHFVRALVTSDGDECAHS